MPFFTFALVALLASGTVSVAAQNTLPGSPLYSLKLNMNEPIMRAITPIPRERAALDAELALKRLDEIEKVASKFELDPFARQTVQMNFQENVARVQERIQDLAEVDARAAADLASNFETALKAHERVLATMIAKGDTDREKVELKKMTDLVKRNADETEKQSIAAEKAVAKQAGTLVESAALGKKKAAENKIKEVRNYLNQKSALLDAQELADARARLAAADELLKDGDTNYLAKQFGKAFLQYAQAHRTAQEAKLLLNVKLDLDVDVKKGPQMENAERQKHGDIDLKDSKAGNGGRKSR